MVTLKDVSKNYNDRTPVLNAVNLELKGNDFLYVVGGTGVGKSTLLRLISTQEPLTSGSLKLFGYEPDKVSGSTLRAIRRAIGYIPQNFKLIGDLSVYDNIALGAGLKMTGSVTNESRERIDELMERLGLIQKRLARADTLSGGEAQRVAVARALSRAPQLIVADEPTGAQDRNYTWQMMELFVKANISGAAVILATHDREIVRRVQKRCVVLTEGTVQIKGDTCFL